PLDGAVLEFVENMADFGNFTATAKTTRTSRVIRAKTDRMTAHISPYENGLAPETHDFVAELNFEAAQYNLAVTFVGLANRIEIAGDIQSPVAPNTLIDWFLKRARKVGFFEGEGKALRKGNSQQKKHLRKLAKRKFK